MLDATRDERTGITSTPPYPVILSDSEESKLASDYMLWGHRGCATWSRRRFVAEADTYLVGQDFRCFAVAQHDMGWDVALVMPLSFGWAGVEMLRVGAQRRCAPKHDM